MRKRTSAGEDSTRPHKRRSRDSVAVAAVGAGAAQVQVLFDSPQEPFYCPSGSLTNTLVEYPDDCPDEHPVAAAPAFAGWIPAWPTSKMVPDDAARAGSVSSASSKCFNTLRRRFSESIARRTRRVRDRDAAGASRPVPAAERPGTGMLDTRSRPHQRVATHVHPSALNLLADYGQRPMLPLPMRTSSLDQTDSRASSPGLVPRVFSHRGHASEWTLPRRDSVRAAGTDSDRESGIIMRESASDVKRRKLRRLSTVGRFEVLIHVFSHLDMDQVLTAARVSQRWNSFATDKVIQATAFLNTHAPRRTSTPAVGGRGIGLAKADDANWAQQDWPRMHEAHEQLQRNWRSGTEKTKFLFGHTDSVYCVQFDDHKAITGSRDRSIRVWDLHTLDCIKVIGGPNIYHQDRRALTTSVPEFTSHMREFLASSGQCRWHLYPDKSKYHVPAQYHSASILCLQYDDEIMVTGSSDSTLIVWDIKTFEPIHVLRKHRSGVLDLAFDKDKIVSCSKDFTVCIWDRRTGAFLHQIEGHHGPVNAVQLRGNLVVSASGEGSSHLYNLNYTNTPGADGRDVPSVKVQLVNEFWSRDRGLACIEFSDDARHVLAGGNDHLIFKYDTAGGATNCVQSMSGHDGLVRSLFLDANNGRIVSGSYDMAVKVWDFATGDLVRTYDARTTSWILNAKSDYRRIVATSQDGRVAVLDFGAGVDGVELLVGA